jgi:hypothetical protein
MLINVAGRMRLPQATDGELSAWPDARPGDMAFSTDRGKVVVFDGASWRELLWA